MQLLFSLPYDMLSHLGSAVIAFSLSKSSESARIHARTALTFTRMTHDHLIYPAAAQVETEHPES